VNTCQVRLGCARVVNVSLSALSVWSGLALGACATESASGSTRAEQGSANAGDAAANAGDAASTANASEDPCSREALRARVDAYYTALAAHDPTLLPLAEDAKYTENGATVPIGEGLWKTAGALTFKRSAIDTQQCTSVTESVIDEEGAAIVLGLRLKAERGQLIEIENIVVRSTERFSEPAALAASASDDWESVLPEEQQATREALSTVAELYFTKFPNGACDFAESCKRLENGFSPPGSCTGSGIGCAPESGESPGMRVRLIVVDAEASIGVGFAMWRDTATDFHMFKVREGQVQGVHAVLAAATSSGWD
jgi:hypothetical protein